MAEHAAFRRALRTDALAGKVALVTGAARGIGRGIALELAHAGAAVALNDLDPGVAGRELEQAIGELGQRASVHQADVANHEAVEAMVRDVIAQYGRLDILINNAGMQHWEPFLEITDVVMQRTLDVDLKGVLFCGQAAARQMVHQGVGGRIINISSVHAVSSVKTAAVYDAAKAGVMRLTATMALELAEHNITVNAIAPGWVDTPMNEPLLSTPEDRAAALATIPLRRIAAPQEIGHLAAFLCSQAAGYITGAFMVIDGGYVLGH